ncbi:hypothetical protein BJ322DRAFT_1053163 [Thelephora terrestris]|uniref:Autophagy-related protein 14 n=1 Tax=Thelephora terrestris TaxID=56493 RepID=A0A9P6L8Q5_9AGAM|nr:hypothetical protein BJ322DRAFT_1053163 [Thelephora terrestris]
MPNSISSDILSVRDLTCSDESLEQRRLRHIEYVQVRNLTPFPVRDAFASALTQPSARSQFNAHGNLSDDLDITIGRRLGRRVSTTSTHTSKSIKSEADDGPPLSPSDGGKKRSSSKASSKVEPQSPLVGGGVRRLSQRSRHSSSIGSSSNIRRREATGTSATTTIAASSVSRVFSDLSQAGLETVVNSRLVETFITVSVPEVATGDVHSSPAKRSFHLPPTSPIKHSPPIPPQPTHRRGPSVNGSGSTSRGSTVSKAPTPTKRPPTGRHVAPKLSSPKTSHRSTVSLSHPFPSASRSEGTIKYPSVPNFISSIHRPSINPAFGLDDLSTPGIEDWTDLSMQKMRIQLWGRVGTGWGVSANVKGKGKEREVTSSTDEWKPLETWEIDLTGLVPLPEHIASNPTLLPSNTLLVRLSPPGQTYCLPQAALSRSPSRPPSPSGGHVSDPEVDTNRSRESSGHTISPRTPHVRTLFQTKEQEPSDHLTRGRGRHLREPAKTASWNDLLKLVNLHVVICETRRNLAEVEHNVDLLIEDDLIQPLKREESQLQRRISDIECDRQGVLDDASSLNERIRAKRGELTKRRNTLAEAHRFLGDQRDDANEADMLLHAESSNLAALRSRLAPTRTTLLSVLASIFPIELLSTPDLLYTILAVPLPIPLSATEPGPPLSMPSHKDVTEEGVATALGFAAQVVQLMALYLGEVLVYPITCIGSRSLIKDGISAMVGSRMFPLFSKGVDTYRFEYGVFLLNKNIEMLMGNYNLRALDMRHTLPNLKNLLLTLTSGEGVQLPRSLSMNSLPTVGLRTPPRVVSPVSTVRVSEATPPTDEVADDEVVVESHKSNSPPGSGSATPTNGALIDSASGRKSMAFLDLSQFTGFLRSRYPPNARSASQKSSSDEHSDVRSLDIGSDVGEGSETVEDAAEVQEEDVSGGERGKAGMNGHANGRGIEEEKCPGEEDGAITPVNRGVLLHPAAAG